MKKCKENNHKWIAPDWLRVWRSGTVDLPMICKDCGVFTVISGINWDLLNDLVVRNVLKNIEFDTCQFIKLNRAGNE